MNAGITEIIFITSHTKRAIEDHFDQNFELEEKLQNAGKDGFLEKYPDSKLFFETKKNKNYFNFNLRGCITYILKKNNISDIWSSKSDTYKYPKRFFSYRY